MNNRGRFQAQGKHLEESEAWAQNEPLYVDEAKLKLSILNQKLSPSERKKRKNAFVQCEQFINRASENGGIDVDDIGKPFIRSFPGNDEERVDIEVRKGKAFLKRDENAE